MTVRDLENRSGAYREDGHHPGLDEIPPCPHCYSDPDHPWIALHPNCAIKLGGALIKDGSNGSVIERFGPGQAGADGIVPSLR